MTNWQKYMTQVTHDYLVDDKNELFHGFEVIKNSRRLNMDNLHTFIETWESTFPGTVKKVMSNDDSLLITLGSNAKSRFQLVSVLEVMTNIKALSVGTYLVTNE